MKNIPIFFEYFSSKQIRRKILQTPQKKRKKKTKKKNIFQRQIHSVTLIHDLTTQTKPF